MGANGINGLKPGSRAGEAWRSEPLRPGSSRYAEPRLKQPVIDPALERHEHDVGVDVLPKEGDAEVSAFP
jgi:hypothetical protein